MPRQKKYTRQDLLNTAMMEFWERGYANTSMADIANVSGVDKKILFRNFENKSKLFYEALSLYCEFDRRHFETIFEKRPLGLDNIKRFLNVVASGHGESPKGCLLNKSMVQHNLMDSKHNELIELTLNYLEQCILKNLKAAKRNGELRENAKPTVLAKTLLCLSQGMNSMSYRQANTDFNQLVESTVQLMRAEGS